MLQVIEAFQASKRNKVRHELILQDLEETNERRVRKYKDKKRQEAVDAHRAKGGAAVVLATVTNARAMSEVVDGLDVGGKLLVVGASPEAIAKAAPARKAGKTFHPPRNTPQGTATNACSATNPQE